MGTLYVMEYEFRWNMGCEIRQNLVDMTIAHNFSLANGSVANIFQIVGQCVIFWRFRMWKTKSISLEWISSAVTDSTIKSSTQKQRAHSKCSNYHIPNEKYNFIIYRSFGRPHCYSHFHLDAIDCHQPILDALVAYMNRTTCLVEIARCTPSYCWRRSVALERRWNFDRTKTGI